MLTSLLAEHTRFRYQQGSPALHCVAHEKTTIVALLHDVIEDTSYTLQDLRNLGFDEDVLGALELMTHDKNVPYMDYVAKIKGNAIAKTVKLADLSHNSDLTRLDEINEAALNRVEKYKAAIKLLSEN